MSEDMPVRPTGAAAEGRTGPAEGTERGEAPGGAEGDALAAAIEAARVAIRTHWQEAGAWSGSVTYDSLADTAVRAAEPILRQAITEELTRTTGLAVRGQIREILATHNAEFSAEYQIDERTRQIIDLIVPAARLQERDRLKAERDGLRGKVEAVRALHREVDTDHGSGLSRCDHCLGWWPCETIRALDGQP